jgi:hypothetical protein
MISSPSIAKSFAASLGETATKAPPSPRRATRVACCGSTLDTVVARISTGRGSLSQSPGGYFYEGR